MQHKNKGELQNIVFLLYLFIIIFFLYFLFYPFWYPLRDILFNQTIISLMLIVETMHNKLMFSIELLRNM